MEIGELRDSIPLERRAEVGHGDLDGADADPAAPHHHSIEGERERGEVRADGEVADFFGDGAGRMEKMTRDDQERAEREERRAHHRRAPVNVEWLFDEVEPQARDGRIHSHVRHAPAQEEHRARGEESGEERRQRERSAAERAGDREGEGYVRQRGERVESNPEAPHRGWWSARSSGTHEVRMVARSSTPGKPARLCGEEGSCYSPPSGELPWPMIRRQSPPT